MKKNRMIRIASVLLIAVLISTCALSGTLAKYVTSETGSDSARVAKWGVFVAVAVGTADGSAFADEYGATVKSSVADDAVVAPGTSGTLLTSSISGAPEVAVSVKEVADLDLGAYWIANGGYYCPIKIVVTTDGGIPTVFNGMDYDTAADFEAAVEGVLNRDVDFAANTNLAKGHVVTWEWTFNGGVEQTDANDSILGEAASAPSISFTYSATVTQRD